MVYATIIQVSIKKMEWFRGVSKPVGLIQTFRANDYCPIYFSSFYSFAWDFALKFIVI